MHNHPQFILNLPSRQVIGDPSAPVTVAFKAYGPCAVPVSGLSKDSHVPVKHMGLQTYFGKCLWNHVGLRHFWRGRLEGTTSCDLCELLAQVKLVAVHWYATELRLDSHHGALLDDPIDFASPVNRKLLASVAEYEHSMFGFRRA